MLPDVLHTYIHTFLPSSFPPMTDIKARNDLVTRTSSTDLSLKYAGFKWDNRWDYSKRGEEMMITTE